MRASPGSNLGTAEATLLKESLSLAEKILSWDFDSGDGKESSSFSMWSRTAADDEIMGSQARRTMVFPGSWRDVVGNTEVLWLFFSVSSQYYAIVLNCSLYCQIHPTFLNVLALHVRSRRQHAHTSKPAMLDSASELES